MKIITSTGLEITQPEDIEFFEMVEEIIKDKIAEGRLEEAYKLIKEREGILRKKIKEVGEF